MPKNFVSHLERCLSLLKICDLLGNEYSLKCWGFEVFRCGLWPMDNFFRSQIPSKLILTNLLMDFSVRKTWMETRNHV